MPITWSKNWETYYYGLSVPLITVTVPNWPVPVQVPYNTYINALNGICEGCGEKHETVEIRHQNTAYADDWKNYHALDEECQVQADEEWDDMWKDYYAGRL